MWEEGGEMNNESKQELRREIVRLNIVGYNKKQVVDILLKQGFSKGTILNYYKVFIEEVGKWP